MKVELYFTRDEVKEYLQAKGYRIQLVTIYELPPDHYPYGSHREELQTEYKGVLMNIEHVFNLVLKEQIKKL